MKPFKDYLTKVGTISDEEQEINNPCLKGFPTLLFKGIRGETPAKLFLPIITMGIRSPVYSCLFYNVEEVELAEQSKEEILQGLQQAVEEMNLIKQGKLKARDARELLNELYT